MGSDSQLCTASSALLQRCIIALCALLALHYQPNAAAQSYDAYAVVVTEGSVNWPTLHYVETGVVYTEDGWMCPDGGSCAYYMAGSPVGSAHIKADIYLARFDATTHAPICSKKQRSGSYSAVFNLEGDLDGGTGRLIISETYSGFPSTNRMAGFDFLAITGWLEPSSQITTIEHPTVIFPKGMNIENGGTQVVYKADISHDQSNCGDGTCIYGWAVSSDYPMAYTDQRTIEFLALDPAVVRQQLAKPVGKLQALGATPQPPSVWTARSASPSAQDYRVSVVDSCADDSIIPNADATLDYSAVANSGGHIHHQGRDDHVGLFELNTMTHNAEPRSNSPFRVNTGAAGSVTVNYVAPQASGQTKITLTCTLPDGKTCEPRDEYINVGVPGLIRLEDATNYRFIGLTDIHPDTRFGTAALVSAMRRLADNYVAEFPTTTRIVNNALVTESSRLFYNDMSLQYGGLLDCYTSPSCVALGGAPWNPPHESHRLGKNADADTTSVPSERRRRVRQIITQELGMRIYDGRGHSTHWHLTIR